MAPLPRELRKSLDHTVVKARAAGEDAARAALSTLAVDRERPFDQMSESERQLRRALRAKARQLGSDDSLVSEIAYQHWHRMLFARFLAENQLLIHPDAGVAVSLEEVADLAREECEPDPWVLAARFAARMLPAIFREHDPTLEVRFAPEGRRRLEDLLAALPASVFSSEDALGWVYQFWQSEKKKQVNKAGDKIGAAELPVVTQLFTEDYMVRFLLENSLGAWWAARHPGSSLVEGFTYLRFTEDGTPAAGTFEGWPERAADVTVMDPCCGSGHFLTVAFEMLTAMRAEEEGLSEREVGDAVIADNLFGLELDPRCTQIAAFALALSAWRAGGYRELPEPNIACSGIGVAGQLSEWNELAAGDGELENALSALHEQFRNAPELGSLVDPRRATDEGHLFSVEYEEVAPLLEKLLDREASPEARVAGWAASGIASAAALLAQTYTFVVTNVPYLTRGKQGEVLKNFSERHYPDARADLANSFLERLRAMTSIGGDFALVTLQKWLYAPNGLKLRTSQLTSATWRLLAILGPGAFETISGVHVDVILLGAAAWPPSEGHRTACWDLSQLPSSEKARGLKDMPPLVLKQIDQLANPGARVVVGTLESGPQLKSFASSSQGICTGDYPRFGRFFWEIPEQGGQWTRQQSTVSTTRDFGGLRHILLWEGGGGALRAHVSQRLGEGNEGAWLRGLQFVGHGGVAVSQAGSLSVSRYLGNLFDNNTVVLVPHDETLFPALWAYCSSPEFSRQVRMVSRGLRVPDKVMLEVPIDLANWIKVAAELYPDGLPDPCSNDPTQWLFKGDVAESTDPLQVAVARLLGYRWPDQEPDSLDDLADSDGAVSIPAVAGEQSAAERLRRFLERAWGNAWSSDKLAALLTQAGAPDKDLDTWLRDSFFASHAKFFQYRPFIWHISDGLKDGFSVLVNYHRLDRQLLDRVTHSLLGDWIRLQRGQVRDEVPGADGRLRAAEDLRSRLVLIAEGEPPYDVHVRWKSIAEQPLGWDPDLDDGVRLNIRPFVQAGVLRSKFPINWNKDRGQDPDGSERLNDLHYSRADKEFARQKAGLSP